MPIKKEGLDLIRKIEATMSGAENDLLQGVGAVERAMFKAIMNRVDKMSGTSSVNAGAKQTAKQMAILEGELLRIIQQSPHGRRAKQFLSMFHKIEGMTLEASELINGARVPAQALAKIRQFSIKKYDSLLLGSGLEESVVMPQVRSIEEMVYSGADFGDIADAVRGFQQGPKGFKRFAEQIAVDSLNQYSGALNQKIGKDLGYEWLMYVGSIIDTSRPQCRKWVDMRFLHKSELRKEINWAKKNGSGMIDATTPGSFLINRGGYRCRHNGYFVDEDNVPDSAKERIR